MHDHNLDDLIIDNINSRSPKRKNLLTIFALAIVVLIVAIILTKTILKKPEQLSLNDINDSEMISPDLTLQNAIKEEVQKEKLALNTENEDKSISKEESTSSTNIETAKVPQDADAIKPKTVAIEEDTTQNIEESIQDESKNIIPKHIAKVEKKEIKSKTVSISEDIFDDEIETSYEQKLKSAKETKPVTKITKYTPAKQEPVIDKKPKRKINITTSSAKDLKATGHYYIQVGSFRQTPSNRFLSVIQKSGFQYKITSPSSSGIKKLLIGPYSNRTEVNNALSRVKDRINKSAFVISR